MSALILIIVNLRGYYVFEEIRFARFLLLYIASDQKFIFLQFEGCKSKIKVSAFGFF